MSGYSYDHFGDRTTWLQKSNEQEWKMHYTYAGVFCVTEIKTPLLLYTLNLNNVMCQLHLNKARGKNDE